ncbi:RsbRD N-terminal domain-containing protein [bacterium]|nr:RsbRD N-terminal domain-containing protein [bacterium]
MLEDLLQKNKTAISECWLELTLNSYQGDANDFFKLQDNRFANPVGQTLARETRALLDELLADMDPERLCTHLEEIIRIRAVQEFTPAKAVSFVFLLKDAIRAQLGDEAKDHGTREELRAIDTRVDQLALFAFDVYVMCREKVFSLRLNEIRKGYVNPA